MLQTNLIPSAHSDLITDAAYDFYGERLATCGLDKRIVIWQLDEKSGAWNVEDDWKAHDAAVSKLSWAHPEFGSIIASSSFDRTVKVWERSWTFSRVRTRSQQNEGGNAAQAPSSSSSSNSRWTEIAVFLEAKGTVRAVEFAPHHFGLKLATISTDNHLRIYECVEQPSLTTWNTNDEIDVLNLRSAVSPSLYSRAQTIALATPTQASANPEGAPPSLVAQALQQGLQQSPPSRLGTNNREADGGWCISWCKDKYWGEIIAVGCGITGTVNIIQLSPPRRSHILLTLDPSPVQLDPISEENVTGSGGSGAHSAGPEKHVPAPFAITCVAWAPSCGRSYHLIATGGRDGRVRIWRVKPWADDDNEETGDGEDGRWTATVVADFDQHKSTVGRVEWNITGTVLSSAGNDGRIRLWKATSGNVWRPATSISVDIAEEVAPGDDHEMDMDRNG